MNYRMKTIPGAWVQHFAAQVNHGYAHLFAPFYPAFDKEQLFNFLEQLDITTENMLSSVAFGQQKKSL